MLSLDWAAVRNGAPNRFSRQVRVACSDPFFECQGHHSIDIHCHVMRSLWNTVYGRQKCVKVGQSVHVRTYRHPWWTAFWSAFGVGWKIAKAGQEQEMLEDQRVTVRKLCERIPEVNENMIGNVAGEFYDKGIWKMPQHMQKCINRNGDYSWKIAEGPDSGM